MGLAASFGGSVIQKVAEEIPSLIERTVFVDALIVEDGHCVFDELPAEYVALFNDLARASPDNTMLIPGKSGVTISSRMHRRLAPARFGNSCHPNLIR